MRSVFLCALLVLLAVAPLAAQAPATPEPAPVATGGKDVRLQGPARVVFEQLGQLYGVRVRVDEALPHRPFELRLDAADFMTALRVACQVGNAFWVAEPDGSILIAPDTAEARSHYEIQVERTFFLPGATPEELSETVRLLREVLDMRAIRQDLRSGTIVVKDTSYRLAVAETLLEQLREDPGEIWLEVLVLELNRNEAQRLGVLPPNQVIAVHLGAGGLALSDAASIDDLVNNIQFLIQQGVLPRALTDAILQASLAAGEFTLPPFILIGGGGTTYAALLPGATLNLFRLSQVTRSSRVLHLRAREGQPNTLFIGERFPIVFTTFSSAFIPQILEELIRQGLFIPPVPAVRYEELGTKLVVVPRLHGGGEVTLDFQFEDRGLTGRDFNGIPVLFNRTLEQQARMRLGETLLISGLQQETTERIITGTPGLSALPILGHLFKRTEPRTEEVELILLLTPHLVRPPVRERLAPIASGRTLYIGTEREFSPLGPAPVPSPPPAQPAAPVQPQPPQPQPPQPQRPPQPQN